MLCCNDPDNEYNNILAQSMREGVDFEIISKDQWMQYEMKYKQQGVPLHTIKRYSEKEGKGIRSFYDIYY